METIAHYVIANRLVIPATYITISILVVLPFLALSAFTETLYINFPDINNSSIFNLQGDATVSGNSIVLTKERAEVNTAWATYNQLLHLWDPTSGHVADFTSNFSFSIQAHPGELYHGDGLTFFLTNGTTIPVNSFGPGLALAGSIKKEYDQSYPPFIAVEFDTSYDDKLWEPSPGEPGTEHVGIDINTIFSKNTTPWTWYNITSGGKVNASIVYNSSQQNLSVKLTDTNNASAFSTVNYHVNLKKILPERVTFGFSASADKFKEIHTIYSWNFVSSLKVQDPPAPRRKKKSNNWQWIITGAGSFLLICLVLAFLWFRRQSKRGGENQSENEDRIEPIDLEFTKVAGPKKISFKEVATATNNFSDDRLLGEGGFGRVYKGYLSKGNCEVAIKKMKITPKSSQGIKEYATEVRTICQLRHRNLVQLVGWCHQKKELLLIYEFMSNGSLDNHLFKGKSLLMWEMRYKIAHGLASALLYLHEEWEQCVLHRDIKASNIMLDSDFNAKLGDFGLARLVDHAKGFQTTILAGTIGYMAPECTYTGKVSKESDIYSFGVVILEIACGRKITNLIDDRIRLVDWVWELYGIGKLLDAVDPKLGGDYDRRQMHCLMVVGLWCTHPDYKRRPTIREVLSVLNFEALPPILPSTPPVPTYSTPQEHGLFPSSISSFEITSSSNGGGYTTTGSSVPSHASSVIASSSASSALLMNKE